MFHYISSNNDVTKVGILFSKGKNVENCVSAVKIFYMY
jgi:hypothetical protein